MRRAGRAGSRALYGACQESLKGLKNVRPRQVRRRGRPWRGGAARRRWCAPRRRLGRRRFIFLRMSLRMSDLQGLFAVRPIDAAFPTPSGRSSMRMSKMNRLFSWSRTCLNGLFLASAEALVKRVSKRIDIAIFGRAVVTCRLERIGFCDLQPSSGHAWVQTDGECIQKPSFCSLFIRFGHLLTSIYA